MFTGEAEEIGSEPADQDAPQEVRLRSSTRSQLDLPHHRLHRPHSAVRPRRGA